MATRFSLASNRQTDIMSFSQFLKLILIGVTVGVRFFSFYKNGGKGSGSKNKFGNVIASRFVARKKNTFEHTLNSSDLLQTSVPNKTPKAKMTNLKLNANRKVSILYTAYLN